MEPFLYLRSISFDIGVTNLMLCFLLFYVWKTRKTYAGFHLWIAASVFSALAYVLISLRDKCPDFLSIVLANACLVLHLGLTAYGLALFLNRKTGRWLYVGPVFFQLAVFILLTYVRPSLDMRIIVISILTGAYCIYCLWILHKYLRALIKGSNALLTGVFLFTLFWQPVRILLAFTGGDRAADFMAGSSLQNFTLVVIGTCYVSLTLGLIVLNFQRVEYDLRVAMDEIRVLQGVIPICVSCKQIRDDKGGWNQVEVYIRDHSEAEFSHSLCPECVRDFYGDSLADRLESSEGGAGKETLRTSHS